MPAPEVLAQPDTELREPSHSSEDQASGSDTVLGTHRLVERRQQLSDRVAYFADQCAALIEIHRMWPGPDAPYFDAGTQTDVAATEARARG